MEPVTLAATAVGYLAPYLAEAGKEGAKKIGGAAADGAVRLLGFLRDKLQGTEGGKVLAKLEAQPADQLNQAMLQGYLRDALAENPALREELRALVEALPTAEQRMGIQGNENISNQLSGTGNTVNIGGRS